MKDKIIRYFGQKGIEFGQTEGEAPSFVFHIPKSENKKLIDLKDEMEKELNVVTAMSDMFGMNVIIVEESENLRLQ